MENKKILFITFDMSGYYDSVHEELKKRYVNVDYCNTALLSYKYKNTAERIKSFFYKVTTGKKLKNFYKFKDLIESIEGKTYDVILVVRPDLFFDSHLDILKKSTNYFVAYYHDSINNIKRKKEVIHFFDKVFSYEKKDVSDYELTFITNFIYSEDKEQQEKPKYAAFSVMSNDFRLATLKNVAGCLKKIGLNYNFVVFCDKPKNEDLVTFTTKRMCNKEVIEEIRKASVIVDIHKYDIQDGLTFRIFESMGYKKKLITTNKDIKTYDFYNPNNIFVIEDHKNVNIPLSFFETPYEDIPKEIYNEYTVTRWIDRILA